MNKAAKKIIEENIDLLKRVEQKDVTTACLWDTIPEEDKYKPMGISCKCKKCSPFSL